MFLIHLFIALVCVFNTYLLIILWWQGVLEAAIYVLRTYAKVYLEHMLKGYWKHIPNKDI